MFIILTTMYLIIIYSKFMVFIYNFYYTFGISPYCGIKTIF